MSSPPYPPIYIPLCFVLHEMISTDGIIPSLVSSGFWLLASGAHWQDVEGQKRDEVTVFIPLALFLLGLMFGSVYVPVPLLQLLCNWSLPLCLQKWGWELSLPSGGSWASH